MTKNTKKGNDRYHKNPCIICCMSVIFTIFFLFSCCYFAYKLFGRIQPEEVFNTTLGLKFDEKLMAEIASLDSIEDYQDTVALKQEIQQLKRLTQYVIGREANYQMEIDLIIDKYSQWTGYWLSVIGAVITLFTILQSLLTYRSYSENDKKVEKAMADGKLVLEEQSAKIQDFVNDMKLASDQNKLSCISACLSSFPDAFSLTPTAERQRFIRSFLKMLHEEYSNFTNNFDDLERCKRELDKNFNLHKEIDHVYLVWCDISIAVNHAMYDFTKPEQNMAFDRLKQMLSTVIIDYHNHEISDDNIRSKMHAVLNEIDKLLKTLL